MEDTIRQHHAMLAQQSEQIKTLFRRVESMEELQKTISSLTTSVALMGQQLEVQTKNMSKMNANIESLQGLPAKRWESIISALLGALIGALVSAIVAKALI